MENEKYNKKNWLHRERLDEEDTLYAGKAKIYCDGNIYKSNHGVKYLRLSIEGNYNKKYKINYYFHNSSSQVKNILDNASKLWFKDVGNKSNFNVNDLVGIVKRENNDLDISDPKSDKIEDIANCLADVLSVILSKPKVAQIIITRKQDIYKVYFCKVRKDRKRNK